MLLRELYIQEDNWVTHKDLANMLYKHTGHLEPEERKQLAIDFYHLESEFDSQDDMQSTGLSALDIDPFEGDREKVNRILSINKVPVKVLKMKHNDAYETLYSLLQSAPVSEAPNKGGVSYKYGPEGKPEWFDRAVQMKLDNPHITATEIAKQVGTNLASVLYWLTGYDGSYPPMMKRPKDSFPFELGDFPKGTGGKRYYDGAKPEWYDQALQMAKAGGSFEAIGKKFGVSGKSIGNWLVKGRKDKYGKLVNPDAELEPRKIYGQKLDVKLLTDFIKDGYTDADIIELVADEKGKKVANQVKNMLPTLRQKLNPGTQVIDKTATGIGDPSISAVSEAPIGSYGKSGSDYNQFDVSSGYKIPKSSKNPNYKADKNLSKAKQISTQRMSKQKAEQLHKQNPNIMQDILRFKQAFKYNTPAELTSGDTFRLARVMLSTGELQDFTSGRFNMGTAVGDGKDDAVKRAKLIKTIQGYVKQNDRIFDNIASKHDLTPHDLTAFVYYITGDDDLAATWFEELKRTLQLENPYDK